MKYVLVTGAAGGMGMAITKRLTDRGYFVFALDYRDFEVGKNTKKIISKLKKGVIQYDI
jgi:NAD(P)-dependent dehydrogenase (short-subunit alcohol dehydrogenase family)